MKVYISGKINGLPPFYSQMRFAFAEKKLKEKGHEVINPWKLDVSDCKEWDDYIMRDLEELRKCDAIYLLSNWQDSNGALVEYHFANGKNLQILHEPSCISCQQYAKDEQRCILHDFKFITGIDSCDNFKRKE